MHDPSARRQHNERPSNNLLIASVSNVNVHRASIISKVQTNNRTWEGIRTLED